MALTREEKTQAIDEMTESLQEAKAVVFTEYRGMTMQDVQKLREDLRKSGVRYKVVKTTLLKIALDKANLSVPAEILAKPLAVAVSDQDEVTPAKVIVQGSKTIEPLKVLGGIVNGEYSDESVIKRLASLPGREELYGKVVGSVASPLTSLVGVLQGNIRGLVSVLSQRQAQLG